MSTFSKEHGYLSSPPVLYVSTVEVTELGLPSVSEVLAEQCTWDDCQAFAYTRYAHYALGRKKAGLCSRHKFASGELHGLPVPTVYRFDPPSSDDAILNLLRGAFVSPSPWYGMEQVKLHPSGMRLFVSPHYLTRVSEVK